MSKRIYYQDRRPANGCARCMWWAQHLVDNWGYCRVNREKTWWQHGPCVEYEKDQDITDDIQLIDMRDEIHDSHRH